VCSDNAANEFAVPCYRPGTEARNGMLITDSTGACLLCSLLQRQLTSGTFVAAPAGTVLGNSAANLLDHWASFTADRSATLARLPPADFEVAGAPPVSCAESFCSADGRFYPSRCGGDPSGNGAASTQANLPLCVDFGSLLTDCSCFQSGDLTTAVANGCRVVFGPPPSWSYMKFVAMEIEARDLPLVITWVGYETQRYNDAAFAAGYDVTLFCECLQSSLPHRSRVPHETHRPIDPSA
jgi:hypothetical protein